MQQVTKYILEYCQHLIDKGVPVQPLPKLKYDPTPQTGPLEDRKTAYYDPESKMVVLYTDQRNDKDVLRSFAHELVHHQQNLQNRLDTGTTTTDTTEDSQLNQLEKEAYLKGNISLRNFLDDLK